MATHLRRKWSARFEGMSRRDRRGCDYDAYLPDRLHGWNLTIPADVAADIADAEAAVRRFNDGGTTHVGLEGLARFLLRAESVASSMIEGLAAARGGSLLPRPISHEAVIRAIRRNDRAATERAMRAHLLYLVDVLASVDSDPPAPTTATLKSDRLERKV